MKKTLFALFAFGAMLASCGENETKDTHDGEMKGDQMENKDTMPEQQTTQRPSDEAANMPGTILSEVAGKKETASGCWWCGDYDLETGPTTLTSPQRICGPDWDGCPIRTTLGDGSIWKKKSPSGCRCDG